MMNYCPVCGMKDPGDECANCREIASQSTMSFSPVSNGAAKPAAEQAAAPLATKTPVLVVIKGPQMGDEFLLGASVTTLGRDTNADIFLNSRTVSRKHATLTRIADTVILQDQGSLNGTYVNGEIVDEIELRDGDRLQIGTFLLQYHRR